MLMATGDLSPRPDLKGRPPPRECPGDFDAIFVEQGRDWCESWYRASKKTVTRWLEERGKKRLIDARAAYVARQRANGQWMTRQTPLVEHRAIRAACSPRQSIRDKRTVPVLVARHAAQHLRIIRHGGFIVSQAPNGDWRVGTRLLSAAQMVDLARGKGFDDKVVIILGAEPALQPGCSPKVNR
jgi:hypothetical protein